MPCRGPSGEMGEPCLRYHGAAGCCRRTALEAEIAAALKAVLEDTSWLAAAVQAKLLRMRRSDGVGNTATAELEKLSLRGREVLGLICRGAEDEAIAAQLGIARNTVRNHVSALFRKAGVSSRTGLVIWAQRRGVIESI